MSCQQLELNHLDSQCAVSGNAPQPLLLNDYRCLNDGWNPKHAVAGQDLIEDASLGKKWVL